MEAAEVEELLSKKAVGPLLGFRSRMGRPFSAVVKLTPDFKAELDFGQNAKADGAAEPVDFTGKEPVGQCPKCGGRVFENGMNYVCENAVGPNRNCTFRSNAVILQQPIDRTQMAKLLTTRKTDLLEKFVSKRNGRTFKAFLVLDKEGKIGFEFAPRESKRAGGARKPEAPKVKLDFTGQEPIGKCPRCGGRVFESETDYLCENSQADHKPCRFKVGKTIAQQPIDRTQAAKLITDGRTDLLQKFISKKGRPFSATLVLQDGGKVGFEFDNSTPPGSA
jgi:uncharacterized C2H2 Zn-finger protein